jgi:hypothetical protein
MNALPPPAISAADARLIDRICDQFEAACKAGARPAVKTYLGTITEPVRSALLRQLLLLDCDYERRSGSQPRLQYYQTQFPDDTAVSA